MSVTAARLPGGRLHLHHGPIDLIVGCDGNGDRDGDGAREAAFKAARARFNGVLEGLMAEYTLLRRWNGPAPRGSVAHAMWLAVRAHGGQATPMAAVAGAVADYVVAAMATVPGLRRAYVNNGGDIALHLTPGTSYRLAMAGSGGLITLGAADPARGVATSGRGGRSLSMGIADAVSVVARDAAAADVAATLIANAVDLPDHPAIARAPADRVRDDSDLGARPVVVALGALSQDEVAEALERGAACARAMVRAGLIDAAALCLRGQTRLVGAKEFIAGGEAVHA